MAALAVLTALAACDNQPAAPSRAAAAPPPVAAESPIGVDFTSPMNALGADPYWALKIRPEGVSFSAPDQPVVAAPNRGPAVAGQVATWTGGTPGDSGAIRVVVTVGVCTDAVSGLSYPFAAKVEAHGRVYTGCATYADAMPRVGGEATPDTPPANAI